MEVEIIHINPGRTVMCDDCNEDYTDRLDCGGLLFQSKAICPQCAPVWRRNAAKYNEDAFIRSECPEGVSFANWVRSLR